MDSKYSAPFLLFNNHLETIFPSLLRKVSLIPYQRERITTPDQDFLDLDWLKQGSKKLIILSHGLEGNSNRPYIRGMAKAGYENGFDILAWNYRGCSEEMNHQLRFYHSGATDDLDTVIKHSQSVGYHEIYLIGFSLGGNITLKYLGERTASEAIKKAVVFSVPMDLHASCKKISVPANRIYAIRFLRSLKEKISRKASVNPALDGSKLHQIHSLIDFDDHYTAPLHGFKNAIDYYTQCSSIHFARAIHVPTLIVNAANDPFLSRECYPARLLDNHSYVKFESPARGGHVGFAQFNKNDLYWSEQRAMTFFHD